MIKVIGVRFRTAGKIYFFDPLEFDIKKNDHVIVETARGVEYGTVVGGIMEVEDDQVVQPLKPVIRIAGQEDAEQETANREKEKEAFRICLEKIQKHGLGMKLINAEYTFDNNKVLFYFTADGRIDFRELVKDLASVFKTRIELRQIGVRDETKMVGGIGICGRPLCCHSYLSDFVPVSIKMAKEQNLSLNPAKISGVCGRLMCCLKNEEETYEELNRKLPGIGDYVVSKDGLKGQVHSVSVLRQMVKVVVDVGDEKEIKEYPVEELQFRHRHGKKDKMDLSKEEMQELERLEEEEQQEQEQAEGGARKDAVQRQGGRNRQGQGEGFQGARRQGGRRPEGGKPAAGRRPEAEQGQYQGSRQRPGGQRQNGAPRNQGRNQDELKPYGRRQEGNRGPGGQNGQGAAEDQNGRQHQGGRFRQDSRNRPGGQYQEGRGRQNGQYQEGRGRQNGQFPRNRSRQENRDQESRFHQEAGSQQESSEQEARLHRQVPEEESRLRQESPEQEVRFHREAQEQEPRFPQEAGSSQENRIQEGQMKPHGGDT